VNSRHTLVFDCLQTADVAKLALQRTGALLALPRLGRFSYESWRRGRDWPLIVESFVRRQSILRYCERLVADDYAAVESHLGASRVEQLVDIGCGYALIDVWFYRKFACDLLLIDIEASFHRDHNFASDGAGYASLDIARELLASNDVPRERVRTCNPSKASLPAVRCDMFVSLLSLAFHFPLQTYSEYVTQCLRPGGLLLIDIRREAAQDLSLLGRFERRTIVKSAQKYDRMLLSGFDP
jgi:SAM-dependent methyltransferase